MNLCKKEVVEVTGVAVEVSYFNNRPEQTSFPTLSDLKAHNAIPPYRIEVRRDGDLKVDRVGWSVTFDVEKGHPILQKGCDIITATITTANGESVSAI